MGALPGMWILSQYSYLIPSVTQSRTKTHFCNRQFCCRHQAGLPYQPLSFKENKELKNTIQIRTDDEAEPRRPVLPLPWQPPCGETWQEKRFGCTASQETQSKGIWFSLISHGLLPVEALNGHQPPWALCPAGIRSCRAQEEPCKGTFHSQFSILADKSWEIPFWLQKSSGFFPSSSNLDHQQKAHFQSSGYILRKVDRMLS